MGLNCARMRTARNPRKDNLRVTRKEELMHKHDWQKQRIAARMTVGIAVAMLVATGCAEIKTAKPEDAEALATLRADREQDNVLVQYQEVRKKEVAAKGQNPDDLDDAEPLRAEPRFKELWDKRKKDVYSGKLERYKELSADVVAGCLAKAQASASADDIDRCVTSTPAATIDPLKAGLLGLGVVGLAVVLFALFRTARRRIDPVAQAGQKANLAVTQGAQKTELTGDYKGYMLRVESSPPEAGQGDTFLRVLVLSKVEPHTLVRFGPLAPPTGLDLPDLNAPEVNDARVPEGYKLRLSPGTSADAMLAGDLGFQLSAYYASDAIDVRVHDGICGVTIWTVPQDPDKVIEFMDLALGCAKLYPQT
jgi:hypothetical protein